MSIAVAAEDEGLELQRVAALTTPYREATKSTLRHRTNWTLEQLALSKARFAKLLLFQRTRISMVLHNSYHSEAVVVYARFAQWLAAQDARLVWSIATALDEPDADLQLFDGLADTPSKDQLRNMNPTMRAITFVECLATKNNAQVLDRLTKQLLQVLAQPGATLPTPATVRLYLSGNLHMAARSDIDLLVYPWLVNQPLPKGGWLYLQALGIHGEPEPLAIRSTNGGKRKRPPKQRPPITDDSEEEEQPIAKATPANEDDDDADMSDRSVPASPVHKRRAKSQADDDSDYESSYRSSSKPKQRASSSRYSMDNAAAASSSITKPKRPSSQPTTAARPSPPAAAADTDVPASAPTSSTTTQLSSRSTTTARPTRPRARFGRQSNIGRFDPKAFTPAIFLRTPMKGILRRVVQVLQRDGTSRRQVAAQIGISQSKISRLLHGKSPFRTAEEEFHMRHWLYLREKVWVAKLEEIIQQRLGRTKMLDFSSLPPPLNAISPPQNLILYMHFLLDLPSRGAIDMAIASVSGIDTQTWTLTETDEVGGEEADYTFNSNAPRDDENEREEEEEMSEEPVKQPEISTRRSSRSIPPPKPRTPIVEEVSEVDEPEEESDASSSSGEGEIVLEADRDELPGGGAGEIVVEEPKRKKPRVAYRPATAPARPTPPIDAIPPMNGLDAWTKLPHAVLRARLLSLVGITNTSQTALSHLLRTSSGTVSMLLRGLFTFATEDDFMKQLREWGQTVDRLAVAKVLSILGADHEATDLPPTVDKADVPIERALLIRPIQPQSAGSSYARLLGMEDAEMVDSEVEAARDQVDGPSSALKELVQLLCQADIPLELETTKENDPNEHAISDDTTAAASSSSSSPISIAPLSLCSWLNFTCAFMDRPRLDALLFPWVERWSSGEDPATANSLDDDASFMRTNVYQAFPLQQDLVATSHRFQYMTRTGPLKNYPDPQPIQVEEIKPDA